MHSAFPALLVLTPIFTKMKTYFITGGAGFIGGNFILNLMNSGQAKVVNYDKLTYAGNLDTLSSIENHPSYTFMQGDICNREKLNKTLGGPIDGVMAEYRCFPESGIVLIPDYLTNTEAATLPCAGLTAWSSLFEEGKIKPGDSVLIQGTGGVSIFALQFAKLSGARTILISGNEEKIIKAQKLGADKVLNYRSIPEWGKIVRELAGGDGVDHIIEVGGSQTMSQSLRAIRPGGTIYMIGVLSGSELKAQLGLIVTRQIRLQGITVGHRNSFERMIQALNHHHVKPVIDKIFPFESLHEALKHLSKAKHFGKICIEF